MEHEPTLADINDVILNLEAGVNRRLSLLEQKLDVALAALPATAPPQRPTAPTDPATAPPTAPTPPAYANPPHQPVPPLLPPPPPYYATPQPRTPPPGFNPQGYPQQGYNPQGHAQAPPHQAPPPPMPAPPPWQPVPRPATGNRLRLTITPERFVRWSGLALVVLAAVFLVSTAIQRGWISPELQLLGATLAGLGLLAGAFRLRDTGPVWPDSLGVAGSVVLAFCAAATSTWLDLVPPLVALGAVALVTGVSGAAAWRLDREPVALSAGLAALWVPPLLGLSGDLSPGTIGLALALLAAAATAVGLVRGWPVVRLGLGWLAALTLVMTVEPGSGRDAFSTWSSGVAGVAALAVATVALWLSPALATHLGRSGTGRIGVLDRLGIGPDQLTAVDHRLAAVVPGWCWAVLAGLAGAEQRPETGRLGLAVAAGFGLVLALTARILPRRLALAHLLGVTAVVAVALIALIDGSMLMVALTAQTAIAGLLAYRFADRWLAVSAGVTGALAVLLAMVGIAQTIDEANPAPGPALAQLTVVAAGAVGALVAVRLRRLELAAVAFVATWVGLLAWIYAVCAPLPQGQAAVSALWAALAAGAIVVGLRTAQPTIRTVGLLTLAVAVAKLLTVDLAAVDVLWRVGLFFLVGAGLLRLAYVLPRLGVPDRDEP